MAIPSQLKHYSILEPLGRGGMGEVYLADDTRLHRKVAIKVLYGLAAADPEHRERFEREARAAAALNHPNIVTLHSVEEADGVPFLTMELVEGRSLAEMIPPGGMPLEPLLRVATSVSDAMAAAHHRGITHRDLKPANVMVTTDGRVKVLDFGLAKLQAAAAPESDGVTAASPAGLTVEGRIIGTVAYMSPEQAEGKPVDPRSDIFSLGVMLYEMATGVRPFTGDTNVSIISAILKDTPKAVTESNPGLPGGLAKVIRRCLAKDPSRRYQTAADLRNELEELKQEIDSGVAFTAPPAAPSARRWVLAAVTAVALLAAVGAALWLRPRPALAPVEWRLRPVTADSGLTTTPALSPDGKLAAYASDRASNGTNLELWVQPLTEGAQPIRLTQNPADDMNPSFSPDGGQIAFFSSREGGGIYLIPTFGGQDRLLVRGGHSPRFSPDGRWIAYSSTSRGSLAESSVFVMPAGGGAAKQIAADIPWTTAPVWSPDGRHLLVLGGATNDSASFEFWLVSPEGGASVKTGLLSLLRERQVPIRNPDWIGDSLFFGSGLSIWTIGFKSDSPKPGELRKLASGTTDMADVRASASKLLFGSSTSATHLWRLPLESNSGKVQGPTEPLTHAGGSQTGPSSSADGSRLAYRQTGANSEELRLRDMNSGTERVLRTGLARPKISPDGAKVAYTTGNPPLGGPLFLMDSSGGEATKLLDPLERLNLYGWTADGKRIVYWHGTPVRFSVFDLDTRQTSVLISHPTHNIHGATLSPDGKWVAFHVPRPGSEPLSIAPVRAGEAAAEAEWITVTTAAGYNGSPWWSLDGNLLYFLSARDSYFCIWAQRLDPGTKRPHAEPMAVYHLHDTRHRSFPGGAPFGPAVERRQIVFTVLERSGNIWLAEPTPAEK